MPSRQYKKGYKAEKAFADMTGGKRVIASGRYKQHDLSLSEDVVLPDGKRVQVKHLRDGFRMLYSWLATADVLALRADHKKFLVVLPVDYFLELYRAYIANRPDR